MPVLSAHFIALPFSIDSCLMNWCELHYLP
jgi:hypothetical protein